jgi:hypothetical protein
VPLHYDDPPPGGALLQGEILGDAVEHRVTYPAIVAARGHVPVIAVAHPLVVVLNNVCDLRWDFDARAEDEEPGTQSGADAETVAGELSIQTADRRIAKKKAKSLRLLCVTYTCAIS